jgi:hypothetical protein
MSILDSVVNSENLAPERISNSIKIQTKQNFESMVMFFNEGAKSFWKNPNATPTQLANSLGVSAKEIFELHYALGQFISSIKPEAIEEGLSVIGQFIMNEDDTVTILPPSGNP